MTDEEKIQATAQAHAQQRSLELLFDYTKFHIGVYLSLTAAYITVATAKINEKPLLSLTPGWFLLAVLGFMIAGLAGGVLASSITQTETGSARGFLQEPIGPWHWKRLHFSGRNWTYIEHTSFWVGLISAVLSFL
jgi:hypothetical protein